MSTSDPHNFIHVMNETKPSPFLPLIFSFRVLLCMQTEGKTREACMRMRLRIVSLCRHTISATYEYYGMLLAIWCLLHVNVLALQDSRPPTVESTYMKKNYKLILAVSLCRYSLYPQGTLTTEPQYAVNWIDSWLHTHEGHSSTFPSFLPPSKPPRLPG